MTNIGRVRDHNQRGIRQVHGAITVLFNQADLYLHGASRTFFERRCESERDRGTVRVRAPCPVSPGRNYKLAFRKCLA